MRRSVGKLFAVLVASAMAGAPAVVMLAAAPASATTVCATPCTIFGSTVPAVPDFPDTNEVELGVKFTADVPGSVTGIRFYKGTSNTGTHTGTLWTSTGTQLATATFAGESASGWQQVTFSSPVAIVPGTTYVASYHTTTGEYAATGNGFATAVDTPPLHALADGLSGGNGVFAYGAHTFPASSFNATNYWVDVLFATPSCTTTCYVNGTTGNDGNSGQSAGAALKTVGAALAAVSPGGTIVVAAGTYTEQLVVNKAVTITGAGQGTTTILGPASLSDSPCVGGGVRAVVMVCGSTGSTVSVSGVTISGGASGEDADASCGPQISGVYVSDAETLDISQSTVTNVYNAAGPSLWGCQQGVGIRAGSKALGVSGNLVADHVTVLDYQKGGIVVDGPGSTGTITNSTVEGDQLAGLSPLIAMNGIQISRGASASIVGNTVSGNKCDHPSCGADALNLTDSWGIALYDPLPGQTPVPAILVSNNVATGNDFGIYSSQLTGTPTISGNTVNANRYIGVYLDEGSATDHEQPDNQQRHRSVRRGRDGSSRFAESRWLLFPGRHDRDHHRQHDQRQPDRRAGRGRVPGHRLRYYRRVHDTRHGPAERRDRQRDDRGRTTRPRRPSTRRATGGAPRPARARSARGRATTCRRVQPSRLGSSRAACRDSAASRRRRSAPSRRRGSRRPSSRSRRAPTAATPSRASPRHASRSRVSRR